MKDYSSFSEELILRLGQFDKGIENLRVGDGAPPGSNPPLGTKVLKVSTE